MNLNLDQLNTASHALAMQSLEGLYEHSPWIAMQHRVFTALFVVQNKLHCNARLTWPLGVRGVFGVAHQIAGVGRRAVVNR